MLDYLRILVATVCFALFVYGFAEYVDFPKGATATLKGLMGFVALGLGSGLIKSTIQERRSDKQRPSSFEPVCHNVLQYGGSPSAC